MSEHGTLVGSPAEKVGEHFYSSDDIAEHRCRTHGNSAPRVVLVPELTAIADIKLDERHSLLRHKDRLR